MKFALAIDRFEGDIAVLLDGEGRALNVPRACLPADCQAGDVLAVTFARDLEAMRRLARETRQVQKDLEQTDPGGDLTL